MEPVGQYRNDIMIGTLCAQVNNFMQSFGKKANRKASEPKDFIPWFVSEEKEREREVVQSEEEVRQRVLSMFGIPSDQNKEDS